MIKNFYREDNWEIINDDVMGGVSKSTFSIGNNGNGIFRGAVSTKNNGGFACVKFKFPPTRVGLRERLVVNLKGDNKTYQIRVKENLSNRVSYITKFTTNGEWEVFEVELKDLYPFYRGQRIDSPNFNADKFEQISFIIANKRDEVFNLELASIELK